MKPFEEKNFIERGKLKPKAKIWAIGGGKGGVGKSFVSSSLGIFLSHFGYKTVIVDLDLGAANLHTNFGQAPGPFGIQNLILDNAPIEDVMTKTNFPNLKLINGYNDALDIADINNEQKSKLLSSIYNLDADYIILDLSAGTHENTIDFFLTAQQRMLVVTPDPSSIENAYRFLKVAFFQNVKRFEQQFGLRDLINEIMSNKNQYCIRNPSDLLQVIKTKDPVNGESLHNLLKQYDHKIILNQTHTLKERDIGNGIQSVCRKYFDVNTDFLGWVDHDNNVWQALRKRTHLLTEYPHSRIYTQLMKITKKLIDSPAYNIAA